MISLDDAEMDPDFGPESQRSSSSSWSPRSVDPEDRKTMGRGATSLEGIGSGSWTVPEAPRPRPTEPASSRRISATHPGTTSKQNDLVISETRSTQAKPASSAQPASTPRTGLNLRPPRRRLLYPGDPVPASMASASNTNAPVATAAAGPPAITTRASATQKHATAPEDQADGRAEPSSVDDSKGPDPPGKISSLRFTFKARDAPDESEEKARGRPDLDSEREDRRPEPERVRMPTTGPRNSTSGETRRSPRLPRGRDSPPPRPARGYSPPRSVTRPGKVIPKNLQ
jgi:hypothetical protein